MWPRRAVGVTLVVLAVILAAVVASFGTWHTDTHTQAFTSPIRRLVVEVDGQVSVRAGARTQVTLTREWALAGAPRSSLEVSDGVLRVQGECAWLHLRCQTHVDATITPDTEVVVVTSAGAITVRGTTAGVDLRTSAGAVDVDQVSGPVRLESSAGAIRGTLNSGDVDARTSAGSITLTLTNRVQRLSAVTSAGSVTLTVPDDIYRVDATTSAGRTDVQVRTDPASTQQITARSSAGSITIHRPR